MTDQKTMNCGHVEVPFAPGTCTPHVIPVPEMIKKGKATKRFEEEMNFIISRTELSLQKIQNAVLKANLAARGLSESLARGTLVEDMMRHMEEERWRNDPLKLKKRFLDPIPVFVAEQLRAIAKQIDP